MPELKLFEVYTLEAAVGRIVPFLEDTGTTAQKAIYFDGWEGLAASAVLRSIAEDPPPSLQKKFDRILHIDCSRWKSRRELQRTIAHELKLHQRIIAALDREDEEDDFSGIDEGSRAEVAQVTMETYQAISGLSCLVIFHNGSDSTVDLSNFGFPQSNWLRPYTLLWTFRGRLQLNSEIKEKVDNSHLNIYRDFPWWRFDIVIAQRILDEATEVVRYMQRKQSITPGIAAKCIWYLLWLSKKGGSTMDYNWATHASNYWICDGIIQGGQFDESWEVSAALHQQIRLEDCSSHTVNFSDDHQYTENWKSAVYISAIEERLSPTLTSFFLAVKNSLPLPHDMFQQSERLRVLKLSGCSFSFYSPPFGCCRSLRFLGLDSCRDQRQKEDCRDQRQEEDNKGRPIMEFLQSLWVLDISYTDWELDLSLLEQMATNIREIHLKRARIWRSNLAWRQLQNLRKLKIIKPTISWETGEKDEFKDMVTLEVLDLSGNSTIQVLPSLCGATGLRTLVLDGCVELDHVGPEGLPPSLESFSFHAGAGENENNRAKISCITLAGCAKLVDFRLLGSLPNLGELDLSGTAVKFLDLKKVHQVEKLQRIFLMGCKQLRAIFWPENEMQQLRLLCIGITDMRFFQSLVKTSVKEFCWSITGPFKLNLYLPCTSMEEGKIFNKDCLRSTGHLVGAPAVHMSLTSKTCCTYNDVKIEEIAAFETNRTSGVQFEPEDIHVEIRQGTINTNVVSAQAIRALQLVMDRVQSLHVHDNSSNTSTRTDPINYHSLKWCRVERCPELETVFVITDYGSGYFFQRLETFWAAHLLTARCIWSKGRPWHDVDTDSFAKLRDIHLYWCPRLQFVLPLSWSHTLSSLETLHIVCCGDLKQVFPVEEKFLRKIATKHRNGMLEFPKLKHLYLHDLFCLQQICEAKIFAPELKTVRLRGCWGLRHLPATARHRQDGRLVAVDCEKDWWEKLEWDGLHVGHHPSFFAPRHSTYYKRRQLRTTVLR